MHTHRFLLVTVALALFAAVSSIAPAFADQGRELMDQALGAAEAGEFEQALDLYEQAADAGAVDAMLVLGAMYMEGFGVEENATLGGDWFLRAAEAGDPLAMHNAGYILLTGLGRDTDPEAAFNWFRAAAEMGFADAMENLALMYEDGVAVEPNPSLAYFWGLLALKRDTSDPQGVQEMLDRLNPKLTDEERGVAEQLAEEWEPVEP